MCLFVFLGGDGVILFFLFSRLDCENSCKNEVLGYMTCCHQLSLEPKNRCVLTSRDVSFSGGLCKKRATLE